MTSPVFPTRGKRKPPKLEEKDTTRTVREYLQLRGWRPVRINAGPFGANGMPDYLFLHYRRRLSMWIEFKAPKGALSDKQAAWITQERAAGALVLVVRDIDEFFGWYEKFFGVEGQTRMFAEGAV